MRAKQGKRIHILRLALCKALKLCGNITEARPSSIVEGMAFYNSNNIYFSSEQLEQMFIMEMEDIIKNLKLELQKTPDTD